ncbi:hypothetical protein GGS23DRAFT_612976 [Durotheca rogersii]|uniref:uncharacterized protein n=1 Tax=Durotheca rogersii TaxID=419775 RepID=UPI00221EA15B|nr:uncharacterized protein GGS23DRAFT_612976 [Durotheca rogersii]KAI5867828.1 hypothetical protein GGS23DRAFT_612976 [Durotheca rogersii]
MYFTKTFGGHAAPGVILKFLEYKDRRQPTKPVDPEMVPSEVYITAAELAQLGVGTDTMSSQPFQQVSPMRTTQPRSLPLIHPQPSPAAHHSQTRERRRSRPKAQVKPSAPSARVPSHIARKPLRRSRNANARKTKNGPSIIHCSIPEVPEERRTSDAIRPELAGAAEDGPLHHGIPLTGTPEQPVPYRPRRSPREPHQEISACSLIERITKAAETIRITSHASSESDDDLARIPKLSAAPRVPRWRVATPHPTVPHPTVGTHVRSDDDDDEDIRVQHEGAIPVLLTPGTSAAHIASDIRTAPVRYACVRTAPSAASLTGVIEQVRARSADEIVIPPLPSAASGVHRPACQLRSDGSIPSLDAAGRDPSSCEVAYFREHGVPPAAHLVEGNRSSSSGGSRHQSRTPLTAPGMLVTIRTPSPSYSCAVQSCFCTPSEADSKVCPSCRERRRLERELQMQWI